MAPRFIDTDPEAGRVWIELTRRACRRART